MDTTLTQFTLRLQPAAGAANSSQQLKRARRKLQDRVRRMQGQVKTPERPPSGTVTKLGDEFGFLEAADGHEVYFHRRSVLNDAFPRLKIGEQGTFVEELGEKGPQASTVKLQGKHRLR